MTTSKTNSIALNDSSMPNWRPLNFFNLFRIGLLVILLLLSSTNNLPMPLGSSDAALFETTLFFYLFASLINTFTLAVKRPSFDIQLHFQLIIDIIFITLLMHASGGVSSGVVMLLVISVANHSALASGQMPSLFAALATIALMLEQTYNLIYEENIGFNYPFAGLFGIVLFATALLTNALAQRARTSEALAAQRGIDLANMAELTEYTITQMKTGVIAVDPGRQIRMFNDATIKLLGLSKITIGQELVRVSPELATTLERWLRDDSQKLFPFTSKANSNVLPQFITIGSQKLEGVLIFLEDIDVASEQAQQVKLAALGRLTAGIAHEIRNPLGAISHASELLNESDQIEQIDQRLTEIIRDNCFRLNNIVETILQLGKRGQQVNSESFMLKPWLESFIGSICEAQSISPNDIESSVVPDDLMITFDSGHLHQILWNLCQNGIRHAHPKIQPILKIPVKLQEDGITIDIIDTGKGVESHMVNQLFEPFATTESSGTGLGLYISKTLANSNKADIIYRPTETGENCFRIKIDLSK